MISILKEFHNRRQLISSKIILLVELINRVDAMLFQEGINLSSNNQSSNVLLNQSKSLLSDNFKILVVGEFSSGKSTFLNALMKENVLPVAVRPTTAAINIIKYSDQKRILLHFWKKENNGSESFDEGEIKEIDYDQLIQFSTSLTEEFDSNSRKVKFVEIFSPIEYCKNGIEILDTPGLSSTNRNHDRVTISYLPKGHTAIMLLNPGQPLSMSERNYLKVIRNYLNRVIFVANKINLLDTEERSTAIEYMTRELKKEMNTDKEIKIYPLNAKLATKGDWEASGFKDFVVDFELFITSNDKARDLVFPPLINSLNIIKQQISILEDLFAATFFSPEIFEDQISIYTANIERITSNKKKVISQISSSAQLLISRFEFSIKNLIQVKLNELSLKLLEVNGTTDEELKDIMSVKVNEEINNLLAEIQAMIQKEISSFESEILIKYRELLEDLSIAEIALYKGNTSLTKPESNYSELVQIHEKEMEKNFLVSIGAGIGAAVIAISAIGGPLGVAIGFFGGNALAKFFAKNAKANAVQELTLSLITNLNKEFTKTIPEAVNNFKAQIRNTGNVIEKKFEGMILLSKAKIDAIRTQLKKSENEIAAKKRLLNELIIEFNNFGRFFEAQHSEMKNE